MESSSTSHFSSYLQRQRSRSTAAGSPSKNSQVAAKRAANIQARNHNADKRVIGLLKAKKEHALAAQQQESRSAAKPKPAVHSLYHRAYQNTRYPDYCATKAENRHILDICQYKYQKCAPGKPNHTTGKGSIGTLQTTPGNDTSVYKSPSKQGYSAVYCRRERNVATYIAAQQRREVQWLATVCLNIK